MLEWYCRTCGKHMHPNNRKSHVSGRKHRNLLDSDDIIEDIIDYSLTPEEKKKYPDIYDNFPKFIHRQIYNCYEEGNYETVILSKEISITHTELFYMIMYIADEPMFTKDYSDIILNLHSVINNITTTSCTEITRKFLILVINIKLDFVIDEKTLSVLNNKYFLTIVSKIMNNSEIERDKIIDMIHKFSYYQEYCEAVENDNITIAGNIILDNYNNMAEEIINKKCFIIDD